ncbi:hypothetical protein D9M68_960140 [compost metagenome]
MSEVMIKAPSALAVQKCMNFIEYIPAADVSPDERFSCRQRLDHKSERFLLCRITLSRNRERTAEIRVVATNDGTCVDRKKVACL